MSKWLEFEGRVKRHRRIRKVISGTKEKPRLCIYRSIKHVHAQLIDDAAGRTILSLSTNSPDLKEQMKKNAGNVKGAVILGTALAEVCKKNGISKIVFDRAGYAYHGRVKAIAEAARKGGLIF